MNEEKWLIGVDLDGTLLTNKHKNIPSMESNPLNIEILRKLDSLGHKVVIVTGRSFFESKKIYDEIGLSNIIINNAGAHIHNKMKNDVNEKYLLDNNEIMKILNDEKLKNHIIAFSNEVEGFCLTHEFKETNFSKTLSKYRNVKDMNFNGIVEKEVLSSNIIFDYSKSEMDEALIYLNENYGKDMHHVLWGNEDVGFGVEINVKSANKGISLLRVADIYGINHKNTIAFGDGTNDVEFLKLAGIGVAMKNSFEGLFEIADEITEFNNNEAGVGIHLKNKFKL